MDKVYSKIYKMLESHFSTHDLFELEPAIMKKYTFYPTESIAMGFHGRVVQDDNQVKGRIYITDFRLIAHGKFGPTALSSIGAAAAAGSAAGGSVAFGLGMNDYIQNKIMKKIQESMGEKFGKRYCFGYQYPIIEAFGINRKKNSIKYRICVEVDKTFGSGKKQKTLKMKIKPDHKRDEILNFLENILKSS
jgi:hypothetical protein